MVKKMTDKEFASFGELHFEKSYLPQMSVVVAIAATLPLAPIPLVFFILIAVICSLLIGIWCSYTWVKRFETWSRDLTIDLVKECAMYLPAHHTTAHRAVRRIGDQWGEMSHRQQDALYDPVEAMLECVVDMDETGVATPSQGETIYLATVAIEKVLS